MFWPLLRLPEGTQRRPVLLRPFGVRMAVELGTGEVEAVVVAAPQAPLPLYLPVTSHGQWLLMGIAKALTAKAGDARVFCAPPLAAPGLGVSTVFVRDQVIALSEGALGQAVRMGYVSPLAASRQVV